MSKHTITVRGAGKASAAPDEIALTLRLSAQREEYEKAMERSAEQHRQIVAALAPRGIRREDIKTASYSVDVVHENHRDESGNYSERFVGYRCSNFLSITLPLDMDELGEVISAVSSSGAEPELDIRFTLHDRAMLREAALREAVENGKRSAALLCASSGARLGRLLKMDYSCREADGCSETGMSVPLMANARAAKLSLQPQDVVTTDTVELTWELR